MLLFTFFGHYLDGILPLSDNWTVKRDREYGEREG